MSFATSVPATESGPTGPRFTDVTAAAGIHSVQHSLPDPPAILRDANYMSGGAAAGDFDDDGFVDLYVTRLDAPSVLYRNRGDGTFEDVTASSGTGQPVEGANGAGWADLDNDGDLDLYVTTLFDDRFYLYVNDGLGHFVEDAVARGAAIPGTDQHFGFSVSFGDYDGDGYLDIHTTEWRPSELNATGAAANARLLRNKGDSGPGHFEDVTQAAGVALDAVAGRRPGTFALTSRFSDLDGDGRLDLAVASDFGTSRLFWNNGDGTFTDGTTSAGVGTDENGTGSVIADFDGDGLLDWFVTSIYDSDHTCEHLAGCHWGHTGNRLYRNNGNRTFSDWTDVAGLRDGGWGSAASFFDYDNDGDADVVMTNGVRFPGSAPFRFPQFEADAMRAWRNDEGSYASVAETLGLTDRGAGKGILNLDYDNDGDLDLFVVNNGGHPVLYRNDGGNAGDWLRVQCVGSAPCFGALVTITAVAGGPSSVAEMNAGSNFLGQDEPTIHFGLGSAYAAPIERVAVRWLDGSFSEFHGVPRNSVLRVAPPGAAVIVAGTDQHLLFGGAGGDVLYGAGGDDVIQGFDGNDKLQGGGGVDTLLGGEGRDVLDGGPGNDVLDGGAGDDALKGGPGDDLVSGGAGDDALDGGEGTDGLLAGEGNDALYGGGGSDFLVGEGGNDRLFAGAANDQMDGGFGDDLLDGQEGDDRLAGGPGDDSLDGGPDADEAYGGDGDDVGLFTAAQSGAGRDFYDGGKGADTLKLTIPQSLLADAAVLAELRDLAGFVSAHADPSRDDADSFVLQRLGLTAANWEEVEVNGGPVPEPPAGLAPVFIDPGAPSGGDGSLQRPLNSWHDVTWVAGGRYLQKAGTIAEEGLHIATAGTAENPIVLGSYGLDRSRPERPVIHGGVFFEGAAHVTLDGFAVKDHEDVGVSIIDGSHHITVANCDISGHTTGVWIAEGAGGSNVILGNLIHNNTLFGVGVKLVNARPGEETVISGNSVLYNASHGIELQGSHYVVEDNEVAYNGFGEIGTSGIHVYSSSPEEDAGDHNVIRNNVTYRGYQLLGVGGQPGPDGNGIELDNWATDNDVYGNISFQNGGTGIVAFRSARARIFDNVLFDNMKSPAHANFARPTELFIGSLSQDEVDQVTGYVVKGNIVVSSGEFSGSSQANITSIFVDAPTIFESRWIGQNRYRNAAGGDFFLWGWDDNGLWGGGELGDSISRWNELKQNGDPDVYGGVELRLGSGVVAGGSEIDLMVGSSGDDQLSGGSGDDVLVGDQGDDELDGGPGSDKLIGGAGDDTYVVDAPVERLWEFPDGGNDVVLSSVSYFLPRNVENLSLVGGDAVNGVGNEAANELRGNDASNVLIGYGGDDYLQGNEAADYLAGGDGVDYLDAGGGSDVLDGGPGDDFLVGREAEDVFAIRKGDGSDVIVDFEGNLRLGGDYLVLEGFGPGAVLSYTGVGGIWRVSFTDGAAPSSQSFVMLGITVLGPMDYEFR